MKASLGRTILYVLGEGDVALIQHNRALFGGCPKHPFEFGNPVKAGDIVPATVTNAWGGSNDLVNGKAMLDGYDCLWLTSRAFNEGKEPGTWHWPKIEGKPVAMTLQSTCGPVAEGVQIDSQGAAPARHLDSITRMDAELSAAASSDLLLLKRLEPLALKLCHSIEEAGASPALTRASKMASNLHQIIAAANRGELLSPYLAEQLDEAATAS